MRAEKPIFSQVMEWVHPEQFRRCVNRYQGNYRVRNFSCWDQFMAKRHAVEMALAEFGKQSDRLLAAMCGVSVPTVGNIRHQLSIFDSSPRLGKDGKMRALPVRGVNGSARREAVGDGASDPLPGDRAFTEVADAMAGLEDMVEKLAHDRPDKTAALLAVIGKVRSDLLQLERRLRGGEER